MKEVHARLTVAVFSDIKPHLVMMDSMEAWKVLNSVDYRWREYVFSKLVEAKVFRTGRKVYKSSCDEAFRFQLKCTGVP